MSTFKFLFLFTVSLLSVSSVFSQSDEKNTQELTGEVIALTQKEFLQKIYNYEKNKDRFVYEGDLPCIIDFYADWCAPCKLVEPVLKELAKEYKGKIMFYKINTDEEKPLAITFGIMSIPTYFFITNKGELQYLVGARPRETFVRVIDEILLK